MSDKHNPGEYNRLVNLHQDYQAAVSCQQWDMLCGKRTNSEYKILAKKALFEESLLSCRQTTRMDEYVINSGSSNRSGEILMRMKNQLACDGADIQESIMLSNRIEHDYSMNAIDRNHVLNILKHSSSSEAREAVWRRTHNVPSDTIDAIRKVIGIRNRKANNAGFATHFEYSLAMQGYDASWLLGFMEKFERDTQDRYVAIKNEIDRRLADRYGLSKSSIPPWFYSDPFLQQVPNVFSSNLEEACLGVDIRGVVEEAYSMMGFSVSRIMRNSAVENELQRGAAGIFHVQTVPMDRSGNVRIWGNLKNDFNGLLNLMHELGHALYYENIDINVPYFLRIPPNEGINEGVAILFGRLTRNIGWLDELNCFSGKFNRNEVSLERIADILVFTRWAIVVIAFQRFLYQNPESNELDDVWNNLVHRYQCVDLSRYYSIGNWASKYHVAMEDICYQNFLIGHCVASQFEEWLTRDCDRFYSSRATGELIRQKVFSVGSELEWNDLIRSVTGNGFDSQYLMMQVGKDGRPAQI